MAPRRKKRRLSHEQQSPNDPDSEPDTKKHQQRRSLFVRSLPPDTTTDTLIAHFSQSFPIKHATAVIDPATQLCKGYGFITFADAEDAQRAVEDFNNTTLQGRTIKLEIAEPRHREYDDTLPSEIAGRPKSTNVPTGAAAEARATRDAARKEALATPPPRLIIRNLPWSIQTPDQLAMLFRSYGKIKNVTIPSKKPGLMSGFGFVTVRGRKNAEKAIAGVNGKEVDGRTLAVDWAVQKDVWEELQNGKTEQDGPKNEQENQAEEESDGFAGLDSDVEEADEFNDDKSTDDADDVDEGSSDDSDDSELSSGQEDNSTDQAKPAEDYSRTLFIRNLPFTSSDDSLFEQFSQFGNLRYARIVIDHDTERPKGTGFVSFHNVEDARQCLRDAPTKDEPFKSGKTATKPSAQSLLQSELDDPTGRYTMEGRVLHVSKAVDRTEAARLTEEGVSHRGERDKDKRRLYLLSEGTISSKSPMYRSLSSTEIGMREASAKQRQKLIQSNPSLHLSLTRLSVRNIPRSVTSKDLKALAREAVVQFAKDVKEGKRERLSREELTRGGDEMEKAERTRKERKTGIVKQAKVVFEGKEGSKVAESSGGGRSRGYGFIEYHSHRLALMGLRWLNGHAIDYRVYGDGKAAKNQEEQMDRRKRLIVEFAIENAQVVKRRNEKELRARKKTNDVTPDKGEAADSKNAEEVAPASKRGKADDKKAKHQRIIAKKRAAKRAKKKTTRAA